MDSCHCQSPRPEPLASGGLTCTRCGLPFDRRTWVRDPRRLMSKAELDALVESIMACGKEACRE